MIFVLLERGSEGQRSAYKKIASARLKQYDASMQIMATHGFASNQVISLNPKTGAFWAQNGKRDGEARWGTVWKVTLGY